MSGFTGNDGSGLVGGLNPSGVVKALSVDASGNLNVNASVSSGPTNITQINSAAVSATNGLPVSGNNSGSLAVIAVDSSGHLLPDIIDRWARQLGQVDIARVLGSALSASNPLFVAQSQNGAVLTDTNPEPNISNVQQMILNGKAFSCSTGQVSAVGNQAMEWFVDGTQSKKVLLWSVRLTYTNASIGTQLQYITAKDAALTGAGVTHAIGSAINLQAGGGAPQAGCTMDYNGGIGTATGTALDFIQNVTTQTIELLSPGMFIYIPASVAGGIAAYCATTAAGKWSVTVRWVEF